MQNMECTQPRTSLTCFGAKTDTTKDRHRVAPPHGVVLPVQPDTQTNGNFGRTAHRTSHPCPSSPVADVQPARVAVDTPACLLPSQHRPLAWTTNPSDNLRNSGTAPVWEGIPLVSFRWLFIMQSAFVSSLAPPQPEWVSSEHDMGVCPCYRGVAHLRHFLLHRRRSWRLNLTAAW